LILILPDWRALGFGYTPNRQLQFLAKWLAEMLLSLTSHIWPKWSPPTDLCSVGMEGKTKALLEGGKTESGNRNLNQGERRLK